MRRDEFYKIAVILSGAEVERRRSATKEPASSQKILGQGRAALSNSTGFFTSLHSFRMTPILKLKPLPTFPVRIFIRRLCKLPLREGVELRQNLGLRLPPDQLPHRLSAFEKKKRGDGVDAEFSRERGAFVHVDFCDERLADPFGGDFLNHRRKLDARAAPWSPEIHEDREGGF